MIISKLRIKQSLSLKVLVINIVFAIFIATIIGIVVQNRVASTVIKEKISISKVETASALYLAQGHFNLARFQDDKELNKVVQDFIASSREDGSDTKFNKKSGYLPDCANLTCSRFYSRKFSRAG
jgi:two-component system sensor histidine kinase MtrB